MEYRQLGKTDQSVSPLALGTDNFANPTPAGECRKILTAAVEAGINLIDTSNSYAKGDSERLIGEILQETGLRDRVLIATKVFYPTGPLPEDRGLSRKAILKACEQSLRNLKTDHIDLYQLHRQDYEVPIEETLQTLDDLVRAGKVRFIGCSTTHPDRIRMALALSESLGLARYVSEQPPYNLLDRRIEKDTIPLCIREGLSVITWSPLAMGMLTGRYSDPDHLPVDSRAILRGGIYRERISEHAVRTGLEFHRRISAEGGNPSQVAVLWAKDQPGITSVIIGPRTIDQLNSLLPVMERNCPLEINMLCDQLVPPGQFVADFHNTAGWQTAI